MTWHLLDVRAVWIKEFAAALSVRAPVLAWCPRISNGGRLRNREEEELVADPKLLVRYFPLQRGFAKFPVMPLAREGARITRRLLRRSESAEGSPLICTSPHYAAVAERWPGPVIYYVTDFFVAYGEDPEYIKSLDRRMGAAATLVCPNSQRVADYLISEANVAEGKIAIIPNATREANLLSQATGVANDEMPADIADLARPLAGVIGNLSANTDWVLLRSAIKQTPWLSWVFVGPAESPINDLDQNRARDFLMHHGGRVRFVGQKPYGQLQNYARAFDVAILPYRKIEPTYSGSSTRFYEHLAACKPIVATRGFEELLHKQPLLTLVDDDAELSSVLAQLRQTAFRDGQETRRWEASQGETWEHRAASMISELTRRVGRSQQAAQVNECRENQAEQPPRSRPSWPRTTLRLLSGKQSRASKHKPFQSPS